MWGKDTLAFAVDQILGKGNSSPLTEYFFWPQDDAWENLKAVLEAKDWIPASEKISMLNRVTEVINFWTPQEGQEQNSTEQAKAKFLDITSQMLDSTVHRTMLENQHMTEEIEMQSEAMEKLIPNKELEYFPTIEDSLRKLELLKVHDVMKYANKKVVGE